MQSANEIKKQSFNLKNEIFEWFEAIVFAVTTVIIIFTFVFRIVGVKGPSMQDTLNDQWTTGINEVEDRVIITNLFGEPKRGDIVVCAIPTNKDPIIKRVIGVEGDKINIDPATGDVFVNDQKIEEDYKKQEPFDRRLIEREFPITVGDGEVFVLGDNRNHSLDSRSEQTGNVKTEYILGKAVFRIFPFDSIGKLD